MARRTNKAQITEKIALLRRLVPDMAIRSTFIAGFPGETIEDLEELADFLKSARLTRAGVFAYSEEEGTPAAKMEGKIEEEEKERRRDYLMEVQQEVSSRVMAEFVGQTLEVMVDEVQEEGFYCARSYMDSPDVDGAVYFTSEKVHNIGETVSVYINDSTEYDLWGTEQ
jgi:ribosomal protein S12 methylthiotransferase